MMYSTATAIFELFAILPFHKYLQFVYTYLVTKVVKVLDNLKDYNFFADFRINQHFSVSVKNIIDK